MPVSNEQARALAEKVWSEPTPPHVTEIAEALLDVLARVADLEGELEVSYESRASASAIVAGNEEISRAIEARDEERLRVAEARVAELEELQAADLLKAEEFAVVSELACARIEKTDARVAELEEPMLVAGLTVIMRGKPYTGIETHVLSLVRSYIDAANKAEARAAELEAAVILVHDTTGDNASMEALFELLTPHQSGEGGS